MSICIVELPESFAPSFHTSLEKYKRRNRTLQRFPPTPSSQTSNSTRPDMMYDWLRKGALMLVLDIMLLIAHVSKDDACAEQRTILPLWVSTLALFCQPRNRLIDLTVSRVLFCSLHAILNGSLGGSKLARFYFS